MALNALPSRSLDSIGTNFRRGAWNFLVGLAIVGIGVSVAGSIFHTMSLPQAAALNS